MSDIGRDDGEVGGFGNIVRRFWGFDRLIGSALIKILYYVGLAVIAIWTLPGVARALDMMRYDAGDGFLGFLLALAMGLFGAVIWRFSCELWLLMFQIYNRLGEIRDRLPPK